MATYEDVMAALREADKQGNTEDAKRLAEMAVKYKNVPTTQAGSTSTITGQTIPTAQEAQAKNIAGYRKVLGAAAPIAGDIALTLAAPEISVAKNAPMLLKIGGKVVNLASKGSGAAAGSGTGSVIGDWIEGKKPDMNKAALNAITGGLFEVGSTVAKPALKWTGKQLAEHTASGKWISDLFREKTGQKITQEASKFADNTGLPRASIEDAEGKVAGVFPKVNEEYQAYNEAFKGVLKANADKPVALDDTIQFLTDTAEKTGWNLRKTLKDIGIEPNSEYGKKLLKLQSSGTSETTIEQAKWLLDGVWKQNSAYSRLSPDTITARESFKSALMADISKISVDETGYPLGAYVVNLKGKADEILKDFTENTLKQNPILFKAFQRSTKEKGKNLWEANPGTLFYDMTLKATPDELLKLKGAILKAEGGKEAWAAYEYAFLNEIFTGEGMAKTGGDKLAKTFKQSDFGKSTAMPYAISENIDIMMPKIEKAFPEIADKLKDVSTYYKQTAKEMEKSNKRTFMSLSGPGVAYAIFGPQGVAGVEAAGALTAWSLMSKNGMDVLEAARYVLGKGAVHGAVELNDQTK